ncbi:cadherin-like beta sandwich domain-containing protein [Clostridium saccharoperbutylacetonicum]|uniref:cadherin-like beta sandwich domain-containing protein n=1 Tax=Clostridium saccharoperbutylacetonicum TaxID=36745 RepID=UPI0039E87E8D
MNKNIKRIIALTLIVNATATILPTTMNKYLMEVQQVYAASYSPDDGQLKSIKVKTLDGKSLDLLDGYNGDKVKLSDETEYYIKQTDKSDGIKIDADVEGDDYIVKIFTSDKSDATAYDPGDKILIGKGDSTVYVRTYKSKSDFRKAKDVQKNVGDCEQEYRLNIRKTTESSFEDGDQDSIYLSKLDVSKGSISFLKEKSSYDLAVAKDVDHINVTAEPENSNDRVRINGAVVDSDDRYKKAIDLDEGKNDIKIKVTDSKDNQRTYTLTVTRGDASNAQDNIYLDNIALDEGSIDFSKDTNSYTVDLDESVSKLKITAQPEDDNNVVTINGDQVKEKDDYQDKVSLEKGKNEIKVIVKDEVNDKERTYTLTVNRGKVQDTQNTDTDQEQTNGKKNGWVKTDVGYKYYDENGTEYKNKWLFDNEKKIYYYLNDSGVRQTDWFKVNNLWYLFDSNGVMLTGWQKNKEQWYMLDKTNGDMKTGWYKETAAVQEGDKTTNVEHTYYLNDDGSMRTGWLQLDNKWYYFDENGYMQKGWVVYANSKYYLDYDGAMVTGTKKIDDKEYKFTESGVLIL